MTTIITRTGKGSPLTWAEADANFTGLNDGKLEKSSNLSDLDSIPTALANLHLNNVSNTSDADKPISTATQNALDGKVDTSSLSASSGSSLVGFIQPGTGAVTMSVQSKLRESVSVKDFGADPAGVTSSVTAFDNAAKSTDAVKVPAGTWLIDSVVPTPAVWLLDAGATITGLPQVGLGKKIDDTSRLQGRIFMQEDNTGCGFRIGDPDPWMERDIRQATESITEVTAISPTGQIAILGASRASDDPSPNMACIGLAGYAINDNVTNPEPAWASYLEARRSTGAGACYNVEMDQVNTGSTFDLDPFTAISETTGQTVNAWLTNGGGDAGLGGAQISAAIGIHPNPATFRRGIVVRSGALDPTINEAVAMPAGAKVAWYSGAGVRTSYMWGRELYQQYSSDTAANGILHGSARWRSTGGTTQNLDTIHRHNFYGNSGSGSYSAGFQQVLQRGTFSGGNARFSYDIQIKGDAGVDHQVTLNGLANASFAPYPDNTISLGTGGFRWSTVYAATGTINTSDERSKQDVGDIDSAVLRAWGKVNYCQFKFRDAVQEKGDGARWHIGLIAQRVKEAFESEGVDPFAYGILCFDEWESSTTFETDSEGVEHPIYHAAGNRYGIRYEEALALECAYLRGKLNA